MATTTSLPSSQNFDRENCKGLNDSTPHQSIRMHWDVRNQKHLMVWPGMTEELNGRGTPLRRGTKHNHPQKQTKPQTLWGQISAIEQSQSRKQANTLDFKLSTQTRTITTRMCTTSSLTKPQGPSLNSGLTTLQSPPLWGLPQVTT